MKIINNSTTGKNEAISFRMLLIENISIFIKSFDVIDLWDPVGQYIPGHHATGFLEEKAEKLVGKKVTWTSPAGKQIKGEVRSAHGNSGAVRVLFETGMPGQALGTSVKLE